MTTNGIYGHLSLFGTLFAHSAMGMYFASGNTGVYLASYLRHRASSSVQLSDNMWFLAAVGLSAIILPVGGYLDTLFGVRAVIGLAGVCQTIGIILTFFAIETNFLLVVIAYGGSFFLSCGFAYTAPIANLARWFPTRKGLF